MEDSRDDKFVWLTTLRKFTRAEMTSLSDGSGTYGHEEAEKEGKLQDQEESDEINACSIVVPVEIDGKTEEWLINFKMRLTTILPRSSLSEVLLPVLRSHP